MIVTDNCIDCCDTLYLIWDGSDSANLGSGIRQCLTYGTLTGKHECSDGKNSRAFDDYEWPVHSVEASTGGYRLPFRNWIYDGISICDFRVLHWPGTQTFYLYKKTLPDFVLRSCCTRHDNTYTIHGEHLINWRSKWSYSACCISSFNPCRYILRPDGSQVQKRCPTTPIICLFRIMSWVEENNIHNADRNFSLVIWWNFPTIRIHDVNKIDSLFSFYPKIRHFYFLLRRVQFLYIR